MVVVDVFAPSHVIMMVEEGLKTVPSTVMESPTLPVEVEIVIDGLITTYVKPLAV